MVNDALAELFPMIDVETLKAELQLLSGTRLGFGATSQAAAAAVLAHSQLFNPVDSNMIVVLERVDLSTPTGQLIEYALATSPLSGGASNRAVRDTREGILQLMVGQVRDVTQAGGLPSFGLISVLSDQNEAIEDKRGVFVLAPGTGITFATTLVNTTFRVSYMWRERVAEPAELNFSSG